MIETDDVLLDSAEETGYRLCRVREALRRPSFAERLALCGDGDSETASVKKDRRGSNISLAGSLGSAVPPTKLKDKLFSVSWDCNDSNVLYLCYQDGRLKVIDSSESSDQPAINDYEVIFRQYLLHAIPESEEELKHEKPIRLHWDKLLTIPGRPRELIFLLGISKSIMYTSLPAKEGEPYPARPILSSLTRGDIAGYNYGTPILQLAVHTARITALAISPLGHILASGDEQGELKLSLLQSPNEDVTSFQQTEDYIAAAHATSLHTHRLFSSSYNLTTGARTHKNNASGSGGPLFALQWLPIVTASAHNDVFQYALASGAADRAVRIWSVSFSLFHGITLCPLLSLDTLSTNLLSLSVTSAAPVLNVTQTRRVVLSSWDALDVDLEDDSDRERQIDEEEDESESEFDETVGGVALVKRSQRSHVEHQELFFAAGTHLGTVHVWRLHSKDICAALEQEGERELREWEMEKEMGGGERDRARERLSKDREKKRTEILWSRESLMEDDGRFLVAILQCSDCPVVHLSSCLSLTFSLPPSASLSENLVPHREVLLAASDVKGRVCMFTTKENVSEQERARELAARMGQESASERLLQAEKERDEWARQDNELLSRIRETYRSALTAAGERERQKEMQRERERDRAILSFSLVDDAESAEEEQLAIRVDEDNEIAREWAMAKERQRAFEMDRERVLFVSLKDDVFSQPVVACTFSPSLVRDEEGGGTNDREISMSRALLVATMDGKLRIFSMARDSDKYKDDDGCRGKEPAERTTSNDSQQQIQDGMEERRKHNPQFELLPSSPRGVQLPDPTRDISSTRTQSATHIPSFPSQSLTGTSTLQQVFLSNNENSAEQDKEANNERNDNEIQPRSALRISSVIRPSPHPAQSSPSRSAIVQKKSISVSNAKGLNAGTSSSFSSPTSSAKHALSTSAKQQSVRPPQGQDMPVSASLSEPLPASLFVSPTPYPQREHIGTAARDAEQILRERGGRIPPAPFSSNELAHPVLHSSKVVVGKLLAVSKKIEDDDFTISTANTTSSDQRIAAQTVQRHAQSGRRYDQLTSAQLLDAQEVDVLVDKMKESPSTSRVAKQVDQKWLTRKNAFALTEKDLEIFKFREPAVDFLLNFAHERDLSGKEKERLRQNKQYGLYSSINTETFQANFDLEINMDDIFGEETVDTQRQRQLDYRVYKEQQSLRRHTSLLSTKQVGNCLPNGLLL